MVAVHFRFLIQVGLPIRLILLFLNYSFILPAEWSYNKLDYTDTVIIEYYDTVVIMKNQSYNSLRGFDNNFKPLCFCAQAQSIILSGPYGILNMTAMNPSNHEIIEVSKALVRVDGQLGASNPKNQNERKFAANISGCKPELLA